MSDITAKLIGTIPPADAGRDAIHVAVIPVVAAEALAAGQAVSLTSDGRGSGRGTPVGVVDPFFKGLIRKGQRFWLFLPPGSITSLRHVWTHPCFAPETPNGEQAEGRTLSPDQAAARKWLEEFAPQFAMDYDQLMQAADDYLRGGEIITQYDSEAWRSAFYDNDETFWRNYEIVTGKRVDEDSRGSFFSCSC